MKKYALFLLVSIGFLTSCKTPRDITYLQDVLENVPIQTQTDGNIRFLPGDKLSIFVHSRDPQLMQLFNLSRGGTGGNSGTYTVDPKGEIDFPVLGPVSVQGLTRDEVAQTIKSNLLNQNLCKDPIVTVEFYNMNFYVLGESGAGSRPIIKDKITLIEAISLSGDLNINGLRKNVMVLRQEGNQQIPYRVDLTSANSVYNSPVYYIRQNDVVYVEPNNKTKRSSTVMGSTAYTPSFWLGMFSAAVSTYLLVDNLVK
jgi:polysaccharide export outer membrane protein